MNIFIKSTKLGKNLLIAYFTSIKNASRCYLLAAKINIFFLVYLTGSSSVYWVFSYYSRKYGLQFATEIIEKSFKVGKTYLTLNSIFN